MYRLRLFFLLLLDVVVVSSIAQRLEDNNFAVATSHLRKKILHKTLVSFFRVEKNLKIEISLRSRAFLQLLLSIIHGRMD